jgi:hypothetical protein
MIDRLDNRLAMIPMLIRLKPESLVEFCAVAPTAQQGIRVAVQGAKPIAPCGERGDEDRRGLLAEGGMRPY